MDVRRECLSGNMIKQYMRATGSNAKWQVLCSGLEWSRKWQHSSCVRALVPHHIIRIYLKRFHLHLNT